MSEDRCFIPNCAECCGGIDDNMFESPNSVTGFVVCVDGEPYVDTFREDPSLAWGAFLPILEFDPELANEEIRLVKMVEE